MAEKRFKLSAEGRKAFLAREHDDMEDDGATLIMEVIARTGDNGITKSNCTRLCAELVVKYGSAEAAIQALRDGKVDVDLHRIQ